ncbi:MAG: bifunctional folylpolyglutamate synthase/dihydrofolate synthase [Defluviitaleaceae bacterium]|nr:bifunctional folylpolyglutamate synthase/dihydrofolate synthase [Defluviitaleaceae bacterium]
MTYQEARQYLADISPMGITLGLARIKNLLNELGNPQDDLKFIHIAGTNGKGSVLAYTSTILERAGYRVGRYVSPTVQSYRERIQLNRTPISKEDFSLQLSNIKQAIERLLAKGLGHPSVFEIETVLGFLYFKAQHCDVVVMETGMGGADDATNVIKHPLVCVFTTVSRDHMTFLGDSLAELTRAKAGIIKAGGQVVYGKLPLEAEEIIQQTAQQFNNPIYQVALDHIVLQHADERFVQTFAYKGLENITIQLLGKHQIENATLAIEAVRSLHGHGFNITDAHIKKGLFETRWFGRVTVVKEKNPVIIVDGAHNQEAVSALAQTLCDLFPAAKIVGVMGVFKDKEIEAMLMEIKPVMREIHAISLPDEQRTLAAHALQKQVQKMGLSAQSHDTLAAALQAATRDADVVVAFGSLSYLGDVLDHFNRC